MNKLSEQQRLALRERFNMAIRLERPNNPWMQSLKCGDVAEEMAWRIVLTLAETHPATFQRRRRVKDIIGSQS